MHGSWKRSNSTAAVEKKLNIELPCARVPRCLYLCDSMDCITHQAPLSVEFSRQEYWSGLPFLTPGDLPSPGIEPMSLQSPVWASSTLTTAPPGKLLELSCVCMLSCFSCVWLCNPRLLCPWHSQVNTGLSCHALLQRILPTQGLNPLLLQLLHWQVGGFFTTSTTWELL